MSEIHVTGLADLQKFLDQLPAKMERNVMRGALRSGAKVIEAQVKANVPVGAPGGRNKKIYGGYRGALRDSVRVTTRRKGGKVTASVKAGGKSKKTGADVYYAHMVEFGTAAHTITAKNRKGLSFGGLFFQSVQHPGARARPFMRPALDGQAQNAVVATAEYIKKRLATKQGLDTSGIEISIGEGE